MATAPLPRRWWSLERPFSLYCAYMLHAHRLLSRAWRSRDELWRQCVRGGLELLDHVVGEVAARGVSILEIDAFACPGLFGAKDREEVSRDGGGFAATTVGTPPAPAPSCENTRAPKSTWLRSLPAISACTI